MRIDIQAEYAWRLAPLGSTEETRFNLNGFAVFPHKEGALIVATNGSALGVFHDKTAILDSRRHIDAEGTIWHLPKDIMVKCKPTRDDGARLILETGDNGQSTATLAHMAGEMIAHEVKVDATFPDWRLVIPGSIPEKCEGWPLFNLSILRQFERCAEPVDVAKRGTLMRVFWGNIGDAALVLTDREDFAGVIMPMKTPEKAEAPAWLKGS